MSVDKELYQDAVVAKEEGKRPEERFQGTSSWKDLIFSLLVKDERGRVMQTQLSSTVSVLMF